MILALLASGHRAPVVVTYHSDLVRQRVRGALFRPIERLAYRRVRAILPTSPAYAPGNSVREFSPAGHQLRSFGTTQAGYGDLGDPGGIAVGPGGRIYVAQPDYGLVSVFSPAGSFYTEFGLQPGPGQADDWSSRRAWRSPRPGRSG